MKGKKMTRAISAVLVLLVLGAPCAAGERPVAIEGPLVLPMERTAYFVGEKIPIGIRSDVDVNIELVNADGRVTAYRGKPAAIILDTAMLAPGDYAVEMNGRKVIDRLTLTSTLRRSF